jgi:D-3-phosphoglycerate dehydrogenase
LDRVRAVVTRGRGRITTETFARLPNLEVAARCGAGLDNVDTTGAAAAGVTVLHAPGLTTHAVSEHAVMLMLSLARRVVHLDTEVKRGHWDVRAGYEGMELRGKRMGVIGLGAIGGRVAQLGQALDMEVVCWTRQHRVGPVPRLELEELLRTSDVVQICVALTPETTGLIGAAQFAAMKQGALVVNTARGSVVDHRALEHALEAGSIGGYGADVWSAEPPPLDDALLRDPRVLVTPHVAGLTDVTYREICMIPASGIAAVLAGREPDPRCVFSG